MISLPARAVIKRELLTGLRSTRPFFFLALFLLILISGLYYLLEGPFSSAFNEAGTLNPGTVRDLFQLFFMGLYCSAMLLIPPMAGVSICVEKQQDSYDLLRMSYIRPVSLTLAKLTNVLGIFVLIVIACLPVVGVFFFLVGVDATQFFISYTLIFLSAASIAVIGVLCSAKFYRTLPAIIATYALSIASQGGALTLIVISTETFAHRSALYRFLYSFSWDLKAALIPSVGLMFSAQGRLTHLSIAYNVVYQCAVIGMGLWLTLRILHRPTEPIHVDGEKPIDSQAQLDARRKSFPYYLLDPRRRLPAIPDSQNAMYAKERQTGLLARGTLGVRILYTFTLLSFFISLAAIGTYGYGNAPSIMLAQSLFTDTVLILVITPTLVATAMAKEWEWQNVDSLRMTLLKPGEIVSGKFRAALWSVALPIAGSLLGNFTLLYFGFDSASFWIVGGMSVISIVVCVFFTMTLSFWCSVGKENTLSALLTAYTVAILVLGLLPFALMTLARLFIGYEPFPRHGDLVYSFFSPIHAWYTLVEVTDLQPSVEGFLYWLFNSMLFLALGCALLAHARKRYERFLDGNDG